MSDALPRPDSPLEAWPLAFRAMGERPRLTGAAVVLSVPLMLVAGRGDVMGVGAWLLLTVLDSALATGVCRSVLLGEGRSAMAWNSPGRVVGWLAVLGVVATLALLGIGAVRGYSDDERVFWDICIIVVALHVWLRLLLVLPALAVGVGGVWRAIGLSRRRGVPMMAGFVLVNLPFAGLGIVLSLMAGYLPLGHGLGPVLFAGVVVAVLGTVGVAVTAGYAARQYRRYGAWSDGAADDDEGDGLRVRLAVVPAGRTRGCGAAVAGGGGGAPDGVDRLAGRGGGGAAAVGEGWCGRWRAGCWMRRSGRR